MKKTTTVNESTRLKDLPQELKDVLCIDVLLELDSTASVSDYYDMFPRIVGDSYKSSRLYVLIKLSEISLSTRVIKLDTNKHCLINNVSVILNPDRSYYFVNHLNKYIVTTSFLEDALTKEIGEWA